MRLYKVAANRPQTTVDSPQQQSKRQEILSALLPTISKELRRKGMTQQRLWEDYIAKHPQGYRCSQFKAYLSEYLNRRSLTMHFKHKAGDKVFINYAGKPLYITDPETGEYIPVQVFLGVLGCSQYTYMEVTLSQKQEDFTESCRRMLEYYDGVPRAIVPDNLKSAVQKGSKYSPVINETFESFAEHYSTSILPTRPRQPREKSLVEGAVKLVYQRIYIHLQNKVFFSLEGLNEAIRPLLASYNERALRGEESRREQFEQLERESLQALPALPY
ncbi:MAG: IS21 family transposase [Algoriphagus sp.]|uniref:IS21 family transposase n=1 Tax=Algoriphagus sp. TaxID=1872435 RepID=UPI0027342BF3|nr:IS21 family transposase [Algoriphagus sp.]MDP3473893.1 IS21 family transposase [Algoriphagus sp.]